MVMGVENGMDQTNLFTQKLEPKLRRGVDKDVPFGDSKKN
jgi:hypothetical protein